MAVRIPNALAAYVDENGKPAGELYSFLLDLSTTVNGMKLQSLTVSQLPDAAKSQGQRYLVTDSDTTTFGSIFSGGNTNVMPVWSDGTDWRIG